MPNPKMHTDKYDAEWIDGLGWIICDASTASTTTAFSIWYGSSETPPGLARLPFFMDPEQISELTPEIDWDKRVGDRIRQFQEWGRKRLDTAA